MIKSIDVIGNATRRAPLALLCIAGSLALTALGLWVASRRMGRLLCK